MLRKWHRKVENRQAGKLKPRDTVIVDSGASGFYVILGAPDSDIDPSAPRVQVGTTAAGHSQESTARCKIPLEGTPADQFAHIMPGFQHSLLGIGIMCDKDCKVLFTKRRVTIYNKNDKPFLTGWRELTGSKLWSVSLQPALESVEP